jgi:hypothetical protein
MKSRDGVQLLTARRPETHIFDAEKGPVLCRLTFLLSSWCQDEGISMLSL